MPTLRVFNGGKAYLVSGRLISDTGTGMIIEDSTSKLRWFAFNHNVIDRETPHADLFGRLPD